MKTTETQATGHNTLQFNQRERYYCNLRNTGNLESKSGGCPRCDSHYYSEEMNWWLMTQQKR